MDIDAVKEYLRIDDDADDMTIDYGQEYENLVGKSYSEELTDSELERMTEECLTENPYITGIENFSCIKQEEKITLTFRLITELGDGEVNTDV